MFPMAGVGLPTLSEVGAENQNVGVLLPSSVLLAPWSLPPELSPGSSARPGAGEHQLLVVTSCVCKTHWCTGGRPLGHEGIERDMVKEGRKDEGREHTRKSFRVLGEYMI